MKPSVISVVDHELLEEFYLALAESKLGIGAEFIHEIQQCGFDGQDQLASFFSGVLRGEGEAIIKTCFGSAEGPDSHQIIALFDSYLSCLSRRTASIITDASKARQTLEALRRTAFYYMSLAIESYQTTHHESRIEEFHGDVPAVIGQQKFFASVDYLIGDESNWKVAIITIELAFGMHPPEAVALIQQEIADRFHQVARKGDVVARFSPHRWALGLRKIKSEAHANLAALKIKRVLEKTFIISDRATVLKNLIGIAIAPDHGSKVEELFRASLKAMRWAEHSEDGIQFYSEASDIDNSHNQHLGAMLYKALFENALELYFQPQFSLSGNRVVGLEALLRWSTIEGFISPPVIIELIEQEGMVPQFTQWLLHTALRNFAEFRQQGLDVTMSINLLPQNFSQEDLPEIVFHAIDLWKVPADRIILEVTESSILQDIEATTRQIRKLKAIGIKISMDDFGTGYSSMSYLSQLDINELKIDQSFVQSLLGSPRDRTIVKAIISLAKSFDLTLVAEGVETEDVAQSIMDLGCDIIQGYWISQPLSPEMLLKWWQHNASPLQMPEP